MRDARICQHALDVVLHEADHVADRHRQGGHDPQKNESGRRKLPPTGRPTRRLDQQEQLDERDEPGEFREEAEEPGHRGGGPLVDVGCVHVERNGGDLVRHAGEREQEADGRQGTRRAECHLAHHGCAGRSVQEAETVDEERGGHRTKEEVLDSRLLRADVAPTDRDEHIRGDTHEFDREEQHDEVVGQAGEQNAGEAEEDHPEDFAAFALRGKVQVQQEHEQADPQADEADVPGEIRESQACQRLRGREGHVVPGRNQCDEDGQHRDRRRQSAKSIMSRHPDEQNGGGADQQDHLGQHQREDVVHRAASCFAAGRSDAGGVANGPGRSRASPARLSISVSPGSNTRASTCRSAAG